MGVKLILLLLFLALFVALPLLSLARLAWRFLHDDEQLEGSSWGKQLRRSRGKPDTL